nr:MAG: tail-collar fiber protein [Bacteriophage sp.]
MSAKFYTLLTDIGAAKLASAAALGVPLKITQMAVGDGGGVLPTPSAQQTALVAEKRRAALNMLYIDPQNSSQIIAEQVIPETEGGWWIREVGLFDETGALIAVGNCPESYKPQLAEGSGRTQTVRMVLITSSTDNITLKIDPSVVLATRKYVDDKVLELRVYVDDLMAKHLAAADPHTQYATKESPTLTGTPKAPTAPAGTNTTQIASTAFVQDVVTALNNALALKAPLASPTLTGTPTAPTAAQTVNNTQVATTAFVKSAIAALVASSPAALDTLNELAAALGNDPNFATTMTNALAGKQQKDATLTNLSGKDVAGLLQYLGLDRFVQAGNNPHLRLILDASSWYVYDDNLKKNIALAVNMGGTGALDAAGARTNFGLGNSATKNTGTTQGTVAAGDDSRITGALQKTGGDVTGALRRVGSYPNILLTDSTMDDATIGKTVGIEQSKGRLTFYLRSGDGSSPSGQVLFNMPDTTGSKTLITKEECDVRYQQQTRLGAESRYGANENYIAVPAGCVMTGLDVGGGPSSETFIGYRPLQVNINDRWATVNQL